MAGTLIGEELTVEGEISGEEEISIQGTVRGTLSTSDAVQIHPGAVVQADITAASLVIGGQVTGNVNSSDRVDLQADGRLVGDVRAARLTIADGASFKGNVDMDV